MNSIGSWVAKGIYQVVEDTITGVYQLVIHPIDSVVYIADVLYNYNRTSAIIVDKIKAEIEKFHTLSTKEKAKFITQISLELATLVTPRGLLKSTAQLQKIADASLLTSTKIVEHYAKASNHMYPLPKYVSDTIPGGEFI